MTLNEHQKDLNDLIAKLREERRKAVRVWDAEGVKDLTELIEAAKVAIKDEADKPRAAMIGRQTSGR